MQRWIDIFARAPKNKTHFKNIFKKIIHKYRFFINGSVAKEFEAFDPTRFARWIAASAVIHLELMKKNTADVNNVNGPPIFFLLVLFFIYFFFKERAQQQKKKIRSGEVGSLSKNKQKKRKEKNGNCWFSIFVSRGRRHPLEPRPSPFKTSH